MKITENIKSLHETLYLLDSLDDVEFLTSNWIIPEEVDVIKSDLHEKINQYKWEAQSYVEYKLTERMDHVILSNGISETIKTLSERKKQEDNKIASIDKRIDYVCKIAWITGLKTPTGEVKYTWGEKMNIIDEAIPMLPDTLKKYEARIEVSPEHKEAIEKMWYLVTLNHTGLVEMKKRYKNLSEEEQKNLEGKIWINNTKSLSIKQ